MQPLLFDRRSHSLQCNLSYNVVSSLCIHTLAAVGRTDQSCAFNLYLVIVFSLFAHIIEPVLQCITQSGAKTNNPGSALWYVCSDWTRKCHEGWSGISCCLVWVDCTRVYLKPSWHTYLTGDYPLQCNWKESLQQACVALRCCGTCL